MSKLQTRRAFIQRTAVIGSAAFSASVAITPLKLFAAEGTFRGRFAICNETFGDWAFDKAFAFAAECGYEGIEIAPFTISNYVTDIPSSRRKEIRQQAEKAGTEIVGLHWLLARTKGIHLTSPDREVRRKTVKYLGDLAYFCADLGGKLLIFGSPKQRNLMPPVTRKQGLEYAKEVLRETLPVLEKTGVRLALEPLSPKSTNFLRTAAEAVELIKMVDSPRCRLILVCNAMATEPTPIANLVRHNRSLMIHFHANDPNRRGPGFGELDFVPIFKALRDIDYSGWVSVEVFDYEPGPERLARESIQYMRECLAKTG